MKDIDLVMSGENVWVKEKLGVAEKCWECMTIIYRILEGVHVLQMVQKRPIIMMPVNTLL